MNNDRNDLLTRLSAKERDDLRVWTEKEIQTRLGHEPTLADVQPDWGQRVLSSILEFIAATGRVITLLAAETAQAIAALALVIVFALLEAERIQTGARQLQQSPEQAALIAFAFVVANVVMPIYRLRNVRGAGKLTRTYRTLRGAVNAFGKRLFALPQTYEVDLHDNPTLRAAEAAITWATLGLAFFAVLGPTFNAYGSLPWYEAIGRIFSESTLNTAIGLISGLFLSFGGVFMLQSISHEIGVRTLTDMPERRSDLLQRRRQEYRRQADAIREDLWERYMAAKLADQERKRQEEQNPTGQSPRPTTASRRTTVMQPVTVIEPQQIKNGNGARG